MPAGCWLGVLYSVGRMYQLVGNHSMLLRGWRMINASWLAQCPRLVSYAAGWQSLHAASRLIVCTSWLASRLGGCSLLGWLVITPCSFSADSMYQLAGFSVGWVFSTRLAGYAAGWQSLHDASWLIRYASWLVVTPCCFSADSMYQLVGFSAGWVFSARLVGYAAGW